MLECAGTDGPAPPAQNMWGAGKATLVRGDAFGPLQPVLLAA
jgi:hypothetical protein